MTIRRKYFYALEEDWPPVLTALEESLTVEYVEECTREDWSNPRYRSWHDLPMDKPRGERFWKRYLIVSPPGMDFPEVQWLRRRAKELGLDPEARSGSKYVDRPQLIHHAGTVLFDPCGLERDYSEEHGVPYIEEGWIVTGHYENSVSKKLFDTLLKGMQKRFANYKGTLFGPMAHDKIVNQGWAFGQSGSLNDWDVSMAKKPKSWSTTG